MDLPSAAPGRTGKKAGTCMHHRAMANENRYYIRIDGIYCAHCVALITRTLSAMDGVGAVSLRQNVAAVSGPSLPSPDVFVETIRGIGYETDVSGISTRRADVARTVRWYEFLLIAAAVLLLAFAVNRLFGYNVFNAIPAVDSSLSYGMLFVTGLLTGIHCLSMCGAIGIAASGESNSVRSLRRPLLYNGGRVLSYTLTGAAVGLAGSVLTVSNTVRGILILAAAVLMLLMALSMLGLLPFRLPGLLSGRPAARGTGAFVIGLLNGLMPCGPLQAMQLYALSTGNTFQGALSMLLFALGTVPLMLLGGAVLNLTRGRVKRAVVKVASVLMMLLALSMLNRGLLALGVDVTQPFTSEYAGYLTAKQEGGIQTVSFELDYDSYADIVVKKDIPVRITVRADADRITGCNNEIISADFGFDVPLVPGDNVIEFTPTQAETFTYTCWMDMIRNHIVVTED